MTWLRKFELGENQACAMLVVSRYWIMGEQTKSQEMETHRQDWLAKLREEFLKLEPLFPTENFLPEEGLPKWVENVEQEIAAVAYPVAKLKEGFKMTPHRMGALLGHSCAFGVWMMEDLQRLSEMPQTAIPLQEVTPEQIKSSEKFVTGIHGVWYPALRRLAKRALCACVDQPYADMTAFLRAYAEAFSRKPKLPGFADIGNPVFSIYIFMATYWRYVNMLKSVRELHELLVKVHGPHRIGELKRIEKICQRIELHYRKPGRPKRLP